MGNAIRSHHPAVVLRSRHKVRALLAVALIAVVGLIAALVIVADDDTAKTSASPAGRINYGDFNPATGRPDAAPLPQRDSRARSDTTRYDGGPEQGSRDIGRPIPASKVYVNPSTGYPTTLYGGSPTKRYDGGPEEGTAGPGR